MPLGPDHSGPTSSVEVVFKTITLEGVGMTFEYWILVGKEA